MCVCVCEIAWRYERKLFLTDILISAINDAATMPRRSDTLTVDPTRTEFDSSSKTLDYDRTDVEEYADLAADVRDRIDGDVQFDE